MLGLNFQERVIDQQSTNKAIDNLVNYEAASKFTIALKSLQHPIRSDEASCNTCWFSVPVACQYMRADAASFVYHAVHQ